MAPFELEATWRHHNAALAVRDARRFEREEIPAGSDDARASALFRGLVYGVPIGLAMWLFLALLLWRLA